MNIDQFLRIIASNKLVGKANIDQSRAVISNAYNQYEKQWVRAEKLTMTPFA